MAKLLGDETIRDIRDRLGTPEKYVRGVLANMANFRRDQAATPVVKIGTTGEGLYPYYRVEPANTGELLADIDGYMSHVSTFNGRSHAPMDWTALEIRGEHWSSNSMSFEEVQSLLGDLRGYGLRQAKR